MFVAPIWAWWVSIAVSAHVTDFGRLQHTGSHDDEVLSRQYFTVRKGRRINFKSADEAVNHFQKRSWACVKKKGKWLFRDNEDTSTEEDDD